LTTESPLATEVIKVAQHDTVMEGVTAWRNSSNGFCVIDLEFTADPDKRSEAWLLSSQSGIPKAQWQREFGKTWIIYDGKAVYQDYDDDIHTARGDIIVPQKAKLLSGWDGGPNDVNLAWVLGIVLPYANAVTIIDEYYVDDGDIYDFVEVVATRLQLEWAKLGGFSIHIADQSVFTQSGMGGSKSAPGKAMSDVMRSHGMSPIPGEISFAKRRQSVEQLLIKSYKWINGQIVPRLRIHERCAFLREGLQGGYCYPKVAGGIGGEYKPTPIKNRFSHVCNALEYLCSRLESATMIVPYEGKPLPRRASNF
jgi:hypothetical protein